MRTIQEIPKSCPASIRVDQHIQHYYHLYRNLRLFRCTQLSPIEKEYLDQKISLIDGFLNALWELCEFGADCIETMQERTEGP